MTTSRSDIPEAAVEAAARADYGNGDQYGTWESEPEEVRVMYLNDARKMLEAAAPHMMAGMEWGVFRASDDEPGTPIENRRYKSRESAQRMIDQGYNPSNIWEVRGRTVGEWAK